MKASRLIERTPKGGIGLILWEEKRYRWIERIVMSEPAGGEDIARVRRTKKDARVSYDRISGSYDSMSGRFEKKYREAGIAKIDVSTGETVLEIGYGTGHSIVEIAGSVGSGGKVYGIDISDGMMRLTKTLVKKAGLEDIVKLSIGDATKLPYKDDFFDAIFMSFTLELFDTPEIPVVLEECQRVLKEGGRIGVVALSKEGKRETAVTIYEWFHREFPRLVDCRPIFLKRSLEEAGYKNIDVALMSMYELPVEIDVARK